MEPKKMLADVDTVAVLGYIKCLAIPTQKIYESDFVHLWVIKDGKIQKFQEFFDTYAAGEAFKEQSSIFIKLKKNENLVYIEIKFKKK